MAVKTLNETTEILVMPSILALAPTALSLTSVFTAPTVAADGVKFLQQGNEVIIVKNSDATNPYTFTIKSVADDLNRLGDIGPYSLAAGKQAVVRLPGRGFKDSTGYVLIVMENVAVQVAVHRAPGQV